LLKIKKKDRQKKWATYLNLGASYERKSHAQLVLTGKGEKKERRLLCLHELKTGYLTTTGVKGEERTDNLQEQNTKACLLRVRQGSGERRRVEEKREVPLV